METRLLIDLVIRVYLVRQSLSRSYHNQGLDYLQVLLYGRPNRNVMKVYEMPFFLHGMQV